LSPLVEPLSRNPTASCGARPLSFSAQAWWVPVRSGPKRYVEHKRFTESFLMNASTSPFYPLVASIEVNAKVHEGKAGEMRSG
jgi:arginine/lysine/ornithine decarboxylase